MFRHDDQPLESCCVQARRSRIPVLLGNRYQATLYPRMLYEMVQRNAPTRLFEVEKTLFGVFDTGEPFWGVYQNLACPTCDRELHVLFLDALLVTVVDQVVRQLYDLLDSSAEDDLIFREANDEERTRAVEVLAGIVFGTRLAPPITSQPVPGQKPYMWLTEAMTLAYAFMVVHETAHQGPQRRGPSSYATYLGPAHSAAALLDVKLDPDQALAWAKELAADVNAFSIIATDSLTYGTSTELRTLWTRAFVAGIALALKSFDLMLREFCYGNPTAYRMLLKTHPPTSFRVHFIARASQAAQRIGFIEGDRLWADRVLRAVDDLHGSKGDSHG